MQSKQTLVQIGTNTVKHAPLGLGGSFYGVKDWDGQQAQDILAAMQFALDNGITHFDTAEGYGGGESEKLIGRFITADGSRRDKMFLASKANLSEFSAKAIQNSIDASRSRLQTDVIDLYYLHWAHTGKDVRPVMEGLESAKQAGKIRAIGVSNFGIEHMEQASEVTQIDAHQLGYSLLWRFPEKDIIPYCVENDIAVVVYSALAHGILSGKYERDLHFAPHDQRWSILHFREDVWSKLYPQVEKFKSLADESGASLVQLAIRWLLQQSSVSSVLISAKNPKQAQSNVAALHTEIATAVLDQLTGISDEAMRVIPDEGNPFGYHP